MPQWRNKLSLTHAPTPLIRVASLDGLVGCELWLKRDDVTAGAESGNKIRKLEYLLADALEQRANVVITCGGVQSNHARATAILARRFGLQPLLALRTHDGMPPATPWQGNLMLDALVGADVRFITPAQYAQRNVYLQTLASEVAARGQRPYVIPEGGSNGLGALGYIDAMAEIRAQVDTSPNSPSDPRPPARFDAVVHACGSGGTAAGAALGAGHYDVASEVIAFAVCDDRHYFEERVHQITREARGLIDQPLSAAALRIVDAYKGPAYGVPSAEQVAFIREVARVSGVILDPVYTGKALFGLSRLQPKPARVLFVHTGGLPGLLAEPELFSW
jgi:D-cysteine desulfhydrase